MQGFFRFLPAANEKAGELPTRPVCFSLNSRVRITKFAYVHCVATGKTGEANMLEDKEERIRAEAYRRWEQEGRPEGQHDRHWQEAAEAVNGRGPAMPVDTEGTTQALKVLKPRAAKPKAEKPAKSAVAEVVKTEAKPAKATAEKAPKAAAAKVSAPAAIATEAPKRSRSKKATALK